MQKRRSIVQSMASPERGRGPDTVEKQILFFVIPSARHRRKPASHPEGGSAERSANFRTMEERA